MQHRLAQLPRDRAVGQRDGPAIGKLEGANIKRIGAAVFGQSGADDTVAAAALEGIEIIEVGDSAAEVACKRRDVGANPVGDRGRHLAAQDRRGLDRDLMMIGQNHSLQPHQILAATAAGTMDVGNARRNRNRFGQGEPASGG